MVYLGAMNLGNLLEGVIERDPLDERLRLRTVDAQGNVLHVDLEDLLSRYEGQEVRFILMSLESIRAIQEMVGGDEVVGVMPEDIGLTLNRTKSPGVGE